MKSLDLYWKDFKKLLRNTKIEVYSLAIAGLILGTAMGINKEKDKDKIIPLAFSEIEQIEDDAALRGETVPFLTGFYAGTNDLVMKVFECSNESYRRTLLGSNTRFFASELENRMDPALHIYRYEISDLVKMLPIQCDSALREIDHFLSTLQNIKVINQNFDDSWKDIHDDQFRIETYIDMETSVDAEGDIQMEPVLKTRIVYDHTIHTYDYSKKEGEEASKNIDSLLLKYPELKLKKEIVLSPLTHAENEYAIEKSREKELEGRRMNQEELLKTANVWFTGSTLNTNFPFINQMISLLNQDAPKWRVAKGTALDTIYTTYSHSDDGPLEFQIAESTLEHGKTLEASLQEIVDGINYVKANAPELDRKIREFIGVVYDNKEGNPNKLKREIIGLAQNIYQINFKRGFDVEPFEFPMVLLYSFLGLLIGAGTGFGLDYLVDKSRLYVEKHSQKN